ncbi:MAG: metallophosphoesterase [Chlorobiaceae bacterium]|jgi:manganese-dependent ADP-ribose/CDP-alcohol diphosphatase|nr:metallophosphoesterase [Chlorobiaceae bacterium]
MSRSDNDQMVRFGIITDIHFLSESEAASTMETSADLLSCMHCWQRNNVDFLLQLGDLINGTDAHKNEELAEVLAVLNTFPGTIRHVLGNHCLAIPHREMMAALGMQRAFYTFAEQEYRFIVLDGMDLSVLREPETEEDRQTLERFLSRPELHTYCGAVGLKQKKWLKGELEKAEQAGEKVIIICHFPLLPETTDPKHGLLWNHSEITDLITSFSAVKACLSGHYHFGSYALHKAIHFVVMPAFMNRRVHPHFTCGTVELQNNRMTIRNQLDEALYDLPLN